MRSAYSRLDTDTGSFQDDLPGCILRQLQVEEAWARRIVLADLINAERLELYAAKRALLWPALLKTQEVQPERLAATYLLNVVPVQGRTALA